MLNSTDNRVFTANHLRLMIMCLKITGNTITCGQTNGIASAKKKIRLSCVIAKTINHRQNAASGTSYLSFN